MLLPRYGNSSYQLKNPVTYLVCEPCHQVKMTLGYASDMCFSADMRHLMVCFGDVDDEVELKSVTISSANKVF
jgi:hypothetical protein